MYADWDVSYVEPGVRPYRGVESGGEGEWSPLEARGEEGGVAGGKRGGGVDGRGSEGGSDGENTGANRRRTGDGVDGRRGCEWAAEGDRSGLDGGVRGGKRARQVSVGEGSVHSSSVLRMAERACQKGDAAFVSESASESGDNTCKKKWADRAGEDSYHRRERSNERQEKSATERTK